MEQSKKIILLDSEDKSKVIQAIVVHKGDDGGYLLSSHIKTADMHWEGTSNYDADGGYVTDGYSLKEGSLYSLSKVQASKLFDEKIGSPLFQNILNKVLSSNKIDKYQLTEDALDTYNKIVKDDFKLVKPEVEKRDAYLQDEMKQKKEAECVSEEKSQEAYSRKILDYLKEFKGKKK